MTRLWTIVAVTCWGIGVLGLAAGFGYSTHYRYNNPQAPDPQTGRIYPSSNRGQVFYVNEHEQLLLQLADSAITFGVIGGLIAGYLGFGRRGQKRPGPE